jgi:hypothetical protein
LIGIWDILLGYGILILFILLISTQMWPTHHRQDQWLRLLFCAIIGLEVDILLRVFILIPLGTYWFWYGMTSEFLYWLWLTAGIITPLKVAIGGVFTVTIGFSLLQILPRVGVPLTEEVAEIKPERPPLNVLMD